MRKPCWWKIVLVGAVGWAIMACATKQVSEPQPAPPPAVQPEPPPAPLAPKSATVTQEGTWIFKDVQFEIDSDKLKPSSYPALDDAVATLMAHPGLRVEIQGHTDTTGSRSYNMKLSQRRAESVMSYLKSKGIAADRMTAEGYGPDKPVDTNKTSQGRAQNRRVEFKPLQ